MSDYKAIVPSFRWWQPTAHRRRQLQALLASKDITGGERGALMDALAGEYQRITLKLQFVVQDCRIGVYWRHSVGGWDGGWWEGWTFYLTLVPMLPLVLGVDRSNRDTHAYRRWKREVDR